MRRSFARIAPEWVARKGPVSGQIVQAWPPIAPLCVRTVLEFVRTGQACVQIGQLYVRIAPVALVPESIAPAMVVLG
jgi:hypothetical protein